MSSDQTDTVNGRIIRVPINYYNHYCKSSNELTEQHSGDQQLQEEESESAQEFADTGNDAE